MKWRQTAVFLVVSALAGCYYEWGVRATGTEFLWHHNDLTGYYNYLTRGFTEGHLYLPVEPDPRLLALPDPLDPNAGNDLPKLFDAVLYNRHYYLYHGVGPAVMLFLPWRLISGNDLPEGFALFVFGFGGYLFAAGTLLLLLRKAGVEVKPWVLGLMLLALAFCQSVPFLLSRVWVYEIAIGGGYFCVAAGLYFLARSLESQRVVWPAAAGLMLTMAVACRPHLGIVTGLGLIAAAFALRRRVVAFVVPMVIVGVAIGIYNFERFGSPFDFGLHYQLTGAYQGVLHLRAENVLPGLYYMLFTRPEFTNIFPWVLIPWPPRSVPRPPLYFVEPIVGALFLAPFVPMAFVALFLRLLGALRWVVVLSGGAIVCFLITTGLSTQRYEVDFLPLLGLAAMAAFGVCIARTKGVARIGLSCGLAASVVFGLVVNLAMGIAGPYDDLMKNKPARYVAIAKWFSPASGLRPQLNPPVAADFSAPVATGPEHFRQDLLSAGRQPWQYELFLDHLSGKPVLVSKFAGANLTKEMPLSAAPVPFHVAFMPQTQEMIVAANGAEVFRHKLDALITAPAQVVLHEPARQ